MIGLFAHRDWQLRGVPDDKDALASATLQRVSDRCPLTRGRAQAGVGQQGGRSGTTGPNGKIGSQPYPAVQYHRFFQHLGHL